MKKLLIVLLLIPGIKAKAQDTIVYKHSKKWIEITLVTVSVVSGGLGDGLNSRAKYGTGHVLSALSYASVLAIPFFVKPSWKFPVTYLLLRYAIFDGMYNVGAHRNLNYIGGKNYYDETVGRMPLAVFDGTKIASIGIVILLNSHNKK